MTRRAFLMLLRALGLGAIAAAGCEIRDVDVKPVEPEPASPPPPQDLERIHAPAPAAQHVLMRCHPSIRPGDAVAVGIDGELVRARAGDHVVGKMVLRGRRNATHAVVRLT